MGGLPAIVVGRWGDGGSRKHLPRNISGLEKLRPSSPGLGLRRLRERHDDFADVAVTADVLMRGGVFPQPIEDTIDGGLERSRG